MRIALCMTVPRLTFTVPSFCLLRSVHTRIRDDIQAKIYMQQGVFWAHALQQCVRNALFDAEGPPDLLWFVDYDSVFDETDVRKLVEIMEENPDIDAVAPMQSHRSRNEVFGYHPTINYADPLPEAVVWMHFGCTLVRPSVFHMSIEDPGKDSKKVPLPWFIDVPDPDSGFWSGPGVCGIKADIHFWSSLQANGGNMRWATDVCIGHQVEAIMWPMLRGVAHQKVGDYSEHGRPKLPTVREQAQEANSGDE